MSDSAPSSLVAGALAGNVTAVARLLTVVERGDSCAMTRAALETVYARAGKAHVVGLTGVPGSGKSTLAAPLARQIRNQGRRVGIVAVDPTSPFSGGAILGDRIRMGALADAPGVFIRSMATRGALGGLAYPAEGNVSCEQLPPLFGQCGQHVGHDWTWFYDIYCYVPTGEFFCQRSS